MQNLVFVCVGFDVLFCPLFCSETQQFIPEECLNTHTHKYPHAQYIYKVDTIYTQSAHKNSATRTCLVRFCMWNKEKKPKSSYTLFSYSYFCQTLSTLHLHKDFQGNWRSRQSPVDLFAMMCIMNGLH